MTEQKYNPHHVQSGADGGQFTSGSGPSGGAGAPGGIKETRATLKKEYKFKLAGTLMAPSDSRIDVWDRNVKDIQYAVAITHKDERITHWELSSRPIPQLPVYGTKLAVGETTIQLWPKLDALGLHR
jgi:hypothetical protein